MAKRADLGAKRADMFFFDPDKLRLITDKEHPLYDDRVKLPLEEAFVRNIMMNGVKVPITVRLNGRDDGGQPIVEVVAGRRRVLHTREANRRLEKEGKARIHIPGVREIGDDSDHFGTFILENEFRKNNNPLERAEKIRRYLSMGRTKEEAAIQFGLDVTSVNSAIAVFECSAKTKAAVRDEQITYSSAVQLSKLPREKQDEAVAQMIQAGATKGAKASAAIKAVKEGRTIEKASKIPGVKMRSRAFMARWLEALSAEKADGIVAGARLAIEAALGGPMDNLPKVLRDSYERALGQ